MKTRSPITPCPLALLVLKLSEVTIEVRPGVSITKLNGDLGSALPRCGVAHPYSLYHDLQHWLIQKDLDEDSTNCHDVDIRVPWMFL